MSGRRFQALLTYHSQSSPEAGILILSERLCPRLQIIRVAHADLKSRSPVPSLSRTLPLGPGANLLMALEQRKALSQSTDMETEAGKGEILCSRPHSYSLLTVNKHEPSVASGFPVTTR